MTDSPLILLGAYFDETLSPKQNDLLVNWLQESADNRREFAKAALLHDRLRDELLSSKAFSNASSTPFENKLTVNRARLFSRSYVAVAFTLLTVAVVMLSWWKGLGESSASAAVVELDRLIAVSLQKFDRTYQIDVEEVVPPRKTGNRTGETKRGRPPKPPLDGATLHVRSGGQFVLIRTTKEELPFVTGSNGKASWAVRSEGPVRVSSDLTRFNRDVPGHEYEMPLINLQEGLERIHAAYDVQLLPIEHSGAPQAEEEALRLLVGVKKRGFRGPSRVEITYEVNSGEIRQLRFVDMPYGPDRLTVRLTLTAENNLPSDFFEHRHHHAPDRSIEEEE